MTRELKTKLIRHITFLEKELQDYGSFKSLSWEEYNSDRNKRRNVERWVENIVNSSVDISKAILESDNLSRPDTYREVVFSVSLVSGFDKKIMKKLSEQIRLRNIIVHEYLDIRWNFIKKFIEETESLYKNFLTRVKKYIEKID